MSVENKIETGNNIPDIKKLLEKKDVDWALSWLWEVSKNTIENKQQELAWCFEIAEFTSNLDENQTNWLNSIFTKFLTPQNLQA